MNSIRPFIQNISGHFHLIRALYAFFAMPNKLPAADVTGWMSIT